MSVAWDLRNRVLVVRLDGDYGYNEPMRAVTAAMQDPGFIPGTPLLIDARRSTTSRSSEEFRSRAIWMAGLTAKGLSHRCAMVIRSLPHQYGLARMAATHVEIHGLELQIFTEIEQAFEWLQEEASSQAAP